MPTERQELCISPIPPLVNKSDGNNLPPLLTWEIENGYIDPIMSPITLQQMRDKLAEARKRLEAVKREVAAWEQVVAVEESSIGIEEPVVKALNKSEILRQYLRSQQKGVTYKMIQTHFEDKGIPMGANFIYNLIDKWEKKGDVEKSGGKISWKADRN